MKFRLETFYFEGTAFLILFMISMITSFPISYSSSKTADSQTFNCISYNPADNVITLNCKSSTITDIYNQLNNRKVLQKDGDEGIWILNAAMKIEKGSTLYINSSDTSWL